LLGEAVLGVGHGLHSRASLLLGLALGTDLLKPADFGTKGKKSKKGEPGGKEQQEAGAAAGVVMPSILCMCDLCNCVCHAAVLFALHV